METYYNNINGSLIMPFLRSKSSFYLYRCTKPEREIRGVISILGANGTVRKHWLVLITLLLCLSTFLIGCSGSTTGHTNSLTPTTIAISTTPKTQATNGNFKSADNGYKTMMDELVKDGTITIAQQVAIQTAITIANQDAAANGDFNCIDNGGSKYVMDGLVKDGTITIAQKMAIQSVIKIAKEDGTMTKDQEIVKTQ